MHSLHAHSTRIVHNDWNREWSWGCQTIKPVKHSKHIFHHFSATCADSEHLCVPRPMAGLGSAEVGKQKQTCAVVRRRFASIIYQWTLPGKTPSRSQQHGCNFPTSTATPIHIWEYVWRVWLSEKKHARQNCVHLLVSLETVGQWSSIARLSRLGASCTH